MSRGVVVDIDKARAAQGGGLKVPTEGVRSNTYTMGIGETKEERAKEENRKEVTDFYWDEVAEIKRVEYKFDEGDETWGATSSISLGVQITDNPVHGNTNPGRWVSNSFNEMKIQEKPMAMSDEELEALTKDVSSPQRWAIMRRREGNSVIRMMGQLLRATGNQDLLVGKKHFVGYNDGVLKLVEGEDLINELVVVQIKQITNNQTGAKQEFIDGFKPYTG